MCGYVRDKRSPVPASEAVSRSMSSNKRKDTSPELILRRLLRESGMPGYRLQWKVKGHPDIAYPGRKVAIFVNGCFWHRCPRCNLPLPKNNVDFWKAKFERNVARDEEDRMELEALGWTVITVWECEIKKEPEVAVGRIMDVLSDPDGHRDA